MSEFQKILEERDELESNIFDLRNKITQCYELIAIKENTIIQLNKKLDKYHLLNHPFYKSWNDGKLTREIIKDYAEQYYQHCLLYTSPSPRD